MINFIKLIKNESKRAIAFFLIFTLIFSSNVFNAAKIIYADMIETENTLRNEQNTYQNKIIDNEINESEIYENDINESENSDENIIEENESTIIESETEESETTTEITDDGIVAAEEETEDEAEDEIYEEEITEPESDNLEEDSISETYEEEPEEEQEESSEEEINADIEGLETEENEIAEEVETTEEPIESEDETTEEIEEATSSDIEFCDTDFIAEQENGLAENIIEEPEEDIDDIASLSEICNEKETIEEKANEASPSDFEENIGDETEDVDGIDDASPSDLSILQMNVSQYPILGADPNNVYWYLTNGDTELHLTSTYASGRTNYDKDSVTNKTAITKVVFDDPIIPLSCVGWFHDFTNLTDIEDIDKLDTSCVMDMAGMFNNCQSLVSVDVSNFNTNNVTDMRFMFNNCSSLTSIDVSNFDTSKVTIMNSMFSSCQNLTSLDVSNFNTSEVTDMMLMFNNCQKLTFLDVSNFNTNKVTSIIYMFSQCNNLVSLDLSNFDISGVTSYTSMLSNCNALSHIKISETVSNKINNVGLSGNWTDVLTGITYNYSSGHTTIPEGEASEYINNPHVYWYLTNSDTELHLTSIYASGRTNYDQNSIANKTAITKVVIDNPIISLSCEKWFDGFTNLTEIEDMDKLDTRCVTNMAGMFNYCQNLATLDVSNFITSNVTDMQFMFQNCQNLATLDVSNFDTSKVTTMNSMFSSCQNLTSIDISNFDADELEYTVFMFYNCQNLTSIGVPNFDTNKVTSIIYMFGECHNLVSLDLSNFDMSLVTDCERALFNCSALNHIKIGETVSNKINNFGLSGNWKNTSTGVVYGYDAASSRTTLPAGIAGEYIKYTYHEYWYLTNSDTELHLSGTLPTAPEYVAGQDSYDQTSVTNKSAITKVVIDDYLYPTSCEKWFEDFDNLTIIENIDKLDTQRTTNMSSMFNDCNKLTILDLSNFNTNKVTNMTAMFDKCYDLTGITFGSNFVTNNVTHMIGMFSGCRSLSTIDLSGFDVSQVEEMYFMFNDCKNLTTLDLSNFDIDSACDSSNLLSNCPNLSHITISESVSNIINDAGLTGDWTDVSTGTVYNYEGSHTTIPEGVAGEYTNNHIYWYLGMSGAVLHLSGTIPTAPEYVPGQDDYNNSCITNKTAIAQVIIDNPIHPTNCESWFNGFEGLLSIVDISNLDTSEVVDMSNMFFRCKNLTTLDVSNFDTTEVTNMASMFQNCENLTTLDVSNFVTNKVTDMNRMFSMCKELTNFDVSNFVTNEVTNMSYMFGFCENVASLSVSNFVTNKVIDMSQMFNNCRTLTSLDVSNFDTSKVTNMSSMFNNCSSLTSLDVSNFDTSKVQYIFSMFSGCSNLTNLDVSDFDTRQVTNIQNMFDGCTNLTSLDLSSFTINPAAYGYINNMLNNCNNLKHIKISESVSIIINDVGLTGNWKNIVTKQVYYYESTHTTIPTNLAGEYISSYAYWYLTNSGSELHLSGTIPTASEYTPGQDYYNKDSIVNKSVITKVVFDNTVKPFNCESWFSGFEGLLTIIDISNLDTSEVVDMSNMFFRCKNLTSLDVSNFNTIEVTNMASMFQNCENLTSLDVSNFVTNKVIDMNHMFSMCKELTSLDAINFTTTEVTNMSFMFSFCENLANINVSNFNTSKVIDMIQMFNNCRTLTSLDVSNFDTSKVTNMSSMFNNCSSLTSLDVSNFDTSKVQYIFSMFSGCSNLTNLDVSNFDTRLVENIQNMFDGCTGLTYLDLSSFTIDPAAYSRITNMLNNCDNLNHIKISESVSIKINDLNLTGDWADTSTGIIYYYDGAHTTIPTGTAGEYGAPITISFDTDGGTVKSDMVVAYGSKLATPTDVIKSGYIIENWYKEPAHTNVWNFGSDSFTEDVTLYANWIYATYIIRYNTNGGIISPTQITKTYNTSVLLTSPTKAGYDFDNWYTDNNTFLNLYDGTIDLADTQDAEVDIYAKWLLDSNHVEINFNSNGGTEVPSQIIEKAIGIVARPTNPTKNGYSFINWYKEPEFFTVWDFDTMLATASMTLHAKWQSIPDPDPDPDPDPHPHSGGGSGGGGGGKEEFTLDPLKINAIQSSEKDTNTYIFGKNSYYWDYNSIKKIWGLNVIANGIILPFIHSYAKINYSTYYFDENGKMVTGWVKDESGDYYAFEWQKTQNEGMMITGWRLINNIWYYFNIDGKLATNTITPDGYKVNANGEWVH